VFKPVYGLCTKLTCKLSDAATRPRLPDDAVAAICSAVGADNLTYLMLQGGVAYEFVKATCANGEVVFERGVDETTPREWESCHTVKFEWSPSAFAEAAAQAQADLADGKSFICEVVSDSLQVSDPATEDCACGASCAVKVELPECEEVEPFTVGKWEYYSEGGCLKMRPATGIIPDGTYENATIVYKDGVPISVTEGVNVIRSSCGSCCDDKA